MNSLAIIEVNGTLTLIHYFIFWNMHFLSTYALEAISANLNVSPIMYIHMLLTIHHCLIFISIHPVQGDVISPGEEHVLLLWDPLHPHRGTSDVMQCQDTQEMWRILYVYHQLILI